MLTLALSPYELTARSRAAALSLLLADTVATLAPADLGGPEADLPAVAAIEFARAWGWTRELGAEGVLAGHAAFADAVHRAWERVRGGALAGAAARSKRSAPDAPRPLDSARAIEDLARGGADPAVRVAVEAGLMRASAKSGLAIVRASGDSVLERLIERAAEPMARVTLPVTDEVDEASIIEMRRLLHEALEPVRDAVGELIAACYAGAEAARVAEVCDRRVGPMAEHAVREAVLLETALDHGRAGSGVRAVSVRIGRVAGDVVIRAAESAVLGRSRPANAPAIVADAPAAVVLTVRPVAWDAASF